MHIYAGNSPKTIKKKLINDFKADLSCDNRVTPEEAETIITKLSNRMRFDNCPLHKKAVLPSACQFCSYGHMLHCHYPYTCSDPKAGCSHYFLEVEES